MPVWQQEVQANEYALNRFEEFALPGAADFRSLAIQHLEGCFERALDRGARIDDIISGAESWVTQRLYARHWERHAADQLRMGVSLFGVLMFPSDPPPGVDIAGLLLPYARGELLPGRNVVGQAEAIARRYGVDLTAEPEVGTSGRMTSH